MKAVRAIVFRYLTDTEFFNIYKAPGTEEGGGGQKYIDFPTSAVTVSNWDDFFSGVKGVRVGQRAVGPSWTFPIMSIGVHASRNKQGVTVYQRRLTSVCIASQHLLAKGQNRVRAWHPDEGFPEPRDPDNRNQLQDKLAIYMARTQDREIWAGWFVNQKGTKRVYKTSAARTSLEAMLGVSEPGAAGYMTFGEGLFIDETNGVSTFTMGIKVDEMVRAVSDPRGKSEEAIRSGYRRSRRSEEELLDNLFAEDEDPTGSDTPKYRKITAKVRRRNTRAVRDLKELYACRCQITGDRDSFKKADGSYYAEAHHLVPLGTGGADSPLNIIIVSPLIHRMLHYADVSDIDLSKIRTERDGTMTLRITINGEAYIISWHSKHAERVTGHAILRDS